MRKLFRDPALQSRFEQDGYIVIDLLHPDVVNEINDAYNKLLPNDGFAPGNGRYHCTFVDTNETYKTQANELFKTYFNPLLEKHLIDYKILTGNFYVKSPGSGEFEVHQNWNMLDETRHTSVTLWTPLQDTTAQNGTIEVVPGSNKIVHNISTLHSGYFFRKFEPALKEKYLKPVNLKVGQAIIFDDNLIHYSRANHSTAPRKAIQLECVPREAQLIFYYLDPEDQAFIEMYETTPAFYLKHNISHVIGRPPMKYLGKLKNRNVFLSEEELSVWKEGRKPEKRFTAAMKT